MRSSGPIASITAWLPLLYDTVAIGLTLKGTAKYLGSRDTGQVFRVMLREGLLYYRYVDAWLPCARYLQNLPHSIQRHLHRFIGLHTHDHFCASINQKHYWTVRAPIIPLSPVV